MATYKVSYFLGKGNAEIIRLAFVAAEKEFVDERLNKEQWLELKPSKCGFFNRSLSPTINVKQLIEARESMPWSIFRIHIHVQPSNR